MISATRLGFWSAVLTAVVAAVMLVVGVSTPARSGPFCNTPTQGACVTYPYTNVAAFIPQDYYWLVPGFLLAPIFVVLMACIHYYASEERRVLSLIGLGFALVYAVVIMIDYFLQFTVVIPSLLSGETAGLSPFTQYSPHGIFIALEGLGYLMMSVALLFAAPVFSGGRSERAVRWLFVASFALAVGSLLILSLLRYDIVAFEVTILTINWIVLIVSGGLLSHIFQRTSRIQGTRPRN